MMDMPKKKVQRLRYGLVAEVRAAFGDAIAVQGAGDPSWVDYERARLRALEREVIGLLHKLGRLAPIGGRHKVRHGTREKAVRQARH